MSLFNHTSPEDCIYLVYLVDRARCKYCLDVLEKEEDLPEAIETAKARHERCMNVRRGKPCAPFAYEIFRTRQDFKAFRAALETERVKYEAQEYREHIIEECAELTREAKALELAQSVCAQFDGKIVNARFYKRLGEVCSCTAYENDSRLNFMKSGAFDFCIYISQNRDNSTAWRWPSGVRLDGAAAAEVLKNCIQIRIDNINEMRESAKKYAAYIRKVRKIEKQLQELTNAPGCVRNFAKEKHLTEFHGAKYIWQ